MLKALNAWLDSGLSLQRKESPAYESAGTYHFTTAGDESSAFIWATKWNDISAALLSALPNRCCLHEMN